MTNTLYTGDNLHFLHRLNSNSVDLIYLDPPFNSKRTYSAPIGSKAAGSSFKDMWSWSDIDEQLLETLLTTHPCLVDFIKSVGGLNGKPMMAYVLYMAQRLVEMHRVLKDTGSIYLHVDPTASHYLKLVMDKIFGDDNFGNEIIWHYRTGGSSKKHFARKHDTILFYTKSIKKHVFNNLKEKAYTKSANRKPGIINYGAGNAEFFQDEQGVFNWVNMRDVWEISYVNSRAAERTGYPTQKPLELLHRIIKASSNEGDIVLDPFCGCATTCVAAQQLYRKWIGIDIEKKAAEVLVNRLGDDAGLFQNFVHTSKLPDRTDIKIEKDSTSIRQKLFKSQKRKCVACDFGTDQVRHFHLDHIIPKSKGGSDTEGNYQLLCGSCNSIKGNRPMEYLKKRIGQIETTLSNEITFGR